MHRTSVANPFLDVREGGFFITYYDFLQNLQILIWLGPTGAIEHEHWLELPTADFAYPEGDVVRLILRSEDPWTRTQLYVAHTCDTSGTHIGPDTLLYLPLGAEELHGGHTYSFANGELTLITSTAQVDVQPLLYTTRVVRYRNRQVTVSPSWQPGVLPENTHIFGWALTPAPFGGGVAQFCVVGNAPFLRAVAFTSEGVPNGAPYDIPVPSNLTVNGISLIEAEGTVYSCYTMNNPEGVIRGGAYLTAFPLDFILPVDEPPVERPAAWSLTAFPNPFNSSIRLNYTVPSHEPITLRIVDVTGRLVERREFTATPGSGSLTWSADGLASGTYFARFETPGRQQTLKLLLVR